MHKRVLKCLYTVALHKLKHLAFIKSYDVRDSVRSWIFRFLKISRVRPAIAEKLQSTSNAFLKAKCNQMQNYKNPLIFFPLQRNFLLRNVGTI